MRKNRLAGMMCALCACLCLSGCVTTADKILNELNVQAASIIEQQADSDELRSVGRDIRQNSETLRLAIGNPDAQVAYSAALSEQMRGQATSERENINTLLGGLWDKLKDVLPGWLLALLTSLTTIWQWVSKQALNKKKTDQVVALISGAQDARDSLKRLLEGAKDKSLSWEQVDTEIKGALAMKQALYNVGPEIKELLDELKAAKTIKEVNA